MWGMIWPSGHIEITIILYHVVTPKRQRLRAGFSVEPGVLPHVAGEEAVPGALEALGP